ncbi:MAG TPA: DUF2520 domain-containing protein [Candidatus Dormibacteraeota bacterium]|nr:DUF2520 domain-containing protein [Candidatus Dormibacteraeota bacterium]
MTETEEGIGLVGAGRLGTALGRRLILRGYTVSAVASRSSGGAARLAAELHCGMFGSATEVVANSELTVLTVPDSAVSKVSGEISDSAGPELTGKVVVHCAGVMGLEVLSRCAERGAHVAVVHPLAPVPDGDPACLEGAWATVEASRGGGKFALQLCHHLGLTPLLWNGYNRSLYHAAAVMAGVLPVVLEGLSERVARDAGMPSESGPALRQLLVLAAANTKRLGSAGGLTGPETRHDSETSSRHFQALANVDSRMADVYRLLLELTSEMQGFQALGGGNHDG